MVEFRTGASPHTVQRSLDVAADAGTTFDGRHLFQLAEGRIQKIDPKSGQVLNTIPAPGGGGISGKVRSVRRPKRVPTADGGPGVAR